MIFILINLLVLVVKEASVVFRVVGGSVLFVEDVATVFRVVGGSLVPMVVMTSNH